MSKHRLYIADGLSGNTTIKLDAETTHYALNVLRLRNGCILETFDGQGNTYLATLCVHSKRDAQITTANQISIDAESPLRIELLQVLSRGEKMDWTIQKAVELGVTSIQPLTSERCNVKLDKKRLQSRYQHWLGVISNACEQCGRSVLPTLQPLLDINELSTGNNATSKHKWVLQPEAEKSLLDDKITSDESVSILIGPEGGLSNSEIRILSAAGFKFKQFGPRILRTETAAIAAIAAIQSQWGDM